MRAVKYSSRPTAVPKDEYERNRSIYCRDTDITSHVCKFQYVKKLFLSKKKKNPNNTFLYLYMSRYFPVYHNV